MLRRCTHGATPRDVHAPLAAYSHQVELPPGQRALVLAGQIGMRPDGTLPDDPIEQLEEALRNVERNLAAADFAIGDLVKLTTYVVGEMDGERRRAAIGAWLGEHRPAMTFLYVAGLASPALRVEVDAWAARA